MLGFVLKDPVPLEVHEELVPVALMRRDIEYEEVEHCDESEALVKLGKRLQEPRRVVEPDREQCKNSGYRGEDDDANQPVKTHRKKISQDKA